MPDLASALHSLNDGFQKKLGELVVVALWAGAGLASKYAWDLVQHWRATRRKAKQSNPVYLASKQISLSIAADRVCTWSGATHVSIYQFSNGQFFNNGDSIQKISMVAEAVDGNATARWLPQSQNLPTSSFPHLLTALGKGHAWLYQDECEDYELNRFMRERGYQSRVVLLLTGPKNVWLGLLCISFEIGHFTDEVLPSLLTLENHRRACAAILAQS